MGEEILSISNLNDFIFCPVSIYFHLLDSETDKLSYQNEYQLNGSAVHAKVDCGKYSDCKQILQAISVYSEKYNLCGKIDTFDISSGILTERKKKISIIYDGYVFQLYAQCFALRELGYCVKKIRLYSYDNNKIYDIPLPEDDKQMFDKFESLLEDINNFKFESFHQENSLKCEKCIYETLCSFSVKKG